MIHGRIGHAKRAVGVAAMLLALGGPVHGQENSSNLRTILQKQQQELQELQERIRQRNLQQVGGETEPPKADLDENAVKKIVGSYLQENPGAGMPPGVQTGFVPGQGFVIRSPSNPSYVKWDDDSRIPF